MSRSSSSEPSCCSSAAVRVHLACSHVTCTRYSRDMFEIASSLCSSAPLISVSRVWLGPLLQPSSVCYSTASRARPQHVAALCSAAEAVVLGRRRRC